MQPATISLPIFRDSSSDASLVSKNAALSETEPTGSGHFCCLRGGRGVVDVLTRDLVGHDRRPASFLVYLWLAEFRASGSELAGAKEIAHRQPGECNGHPKLHRAEPVAGYCTPRRSPP
jgi:hypothetical protein